MVDRRGIEDVLMALSEICGWKAQHIQDRKETDFGTRIANF
jgi:hypothetical protein